VEADWPWRREIGEAREAMVCADETLFVIL